MDTVDCLNAAFAADPNAIHALLLNRVPCNQSLADDPYILVDAAQTLPAGFFQVGALGLVNGVLAANGLPLVAVQFSESVDIEGRHKILGFCRYEPKEQNDTRRDQTKDS